MKRKGMILSIALLVIFYSTAQAQDYKLGLGVRFSTNAAIVNHSISFKYFFSEKTAGEALFSVVDPFALGLLIEQHKAIATNNLKFFYGGGAFVAFGGDRVAGMQGILGLDFKLPALPLNLSVDWKPELAVVKEFSFEPAALGISARFTLK